MSSSRSGTVAGAGLMVFFKLVDRSLGLVSTIVLARLLTPGDFGIVAMAVSVIALLELFGAFNLDATLIQRGADVRREHFDTAWTLNVATAAVVALLLLAAAWPLAAFYREPRLSPVICVLACSSLVQGFENVGTVMFRKELDFQREFKFLVAKRMLTFAITIPLAFWLRDYWALVVGTIVGKSGGVALSYLAHPYRPRFSLRAAGELLSFSKWMLLHNIISFLKDRSANFVVGRYANATSLGLFTLASEIASLPSTELIAPINRALLPYYAKIAGDRAVLGREYLAAMGAIAMIGVPAVAGVVLTAPYVVALFLGPKWSGVVPLLEILAFFGITQVLQTNAFSAFIALGRPKAYAIINAIHVAVLLVLLLVLTPRYGVIGTAWAYAVTALILLPVNLVLIKRWLELSARGLLACLWRPFAAAAAMYGTVRWLGGGGAVRSAPLGTLDAALTLALVVAAGAATYVGAVIALWLASGRPRGAETWIAARLVPVLPAPLAARLRALAAM